MPLELKNIKGGGLHYVNEMRSTETQIWQGGLKHFTRHHDRLMTGTRSLPTDYHDKIDYERGYIIHSRSPANQRFNFHYMYGGFKKFFVERWLYQHFYKSMVRKTWAPALICYALGCYGMRQYDNASHDFFYFTD